jgi:O-Antigen ligase
MRRLAWVLLLVYAFAIPWEYSLDVGPPLGNAARIAGVLLLIIAIPAVFENGRIRTPGALQWMVLAFYLFFCCSLFWTLDKPATLEKMRGFFQEMMVVWLVWEFADSPRDLRSLLRAFVAGSWILALLTLANFSSPETIAAGQARFAAYGQDPNDVARFLDIGFPLAALLESSESRWPGRFLALGYLPLGLVAVLLTASRGGFVAAIVAMAGCAAILMRTHIRAVLISSLALPAVAFGLWFVIPHEIFDRLATIPQQLAGGDLNQRVNIWWAGWHAFTRAPILGTGAGTFVAAARLAPGDTAHNTLLSVGVAGGLCAVTLAVIILALVCRSALKTDGHLRLALLVALAVWVITSLTLTVEESRVTWLLFAIVALAGRCAEENHAELADCFPAPDRIGPFTGLHAESIGG